MSIPFAHLHRHTGFSDYDGLGTPEQGVLYAKKLGMSHLAITDHMTASGNEQHHHACKKHGLTDIQGCEIYFMQEFKAGKEYASQRRHLTLLAKNLNGYRNLCKIMTHANINNFYMKPIADYNLLEKFSDDIICLSGCVIGEIPYHLIQGDWDEACRQTDKFLSIYRDRFFFELMPYSVINDENVDMQKKANDGLVKLSQKFGRPAVLTNDVHRIESSDLETYILFRKMGPIKIDEAKEEAIRNQYRNLYMVDGETICKSWHDLMGTDGTAYAIQSQTIANTCEQYSLVFTEDVPEHIEIGDDGYKIPVEKVLARRVKKGLQALGKWDNPEYVERAKKELKVILSKSGKADYFLLTADMVAFARKNNVPVGPGRGSGVASLVAHALGIIQIDPIYFDLMFERFMHEERENLPDFDVDFSSSKYHIVIDYLTKKLHGHVAQICNIIYYKVDNLLNDLAKALDIAPDELITLKTVLAKMRYKELQPDISVMLKDRRLMSLELRYRVMSHFVKIYGNPKAFGQHASGVAVTQHAMNDYMPLFVRGKETERRINTAYDKESLARMNVVKVDVLRVKEIDIVYGCCNKLKIDPINIPLDDSKTYDSYNKLNLKGIFQFDSYGGHTVVEKVKPITIFDIMDATSLNRPGALSMDQIGTYLNGKSLHQQGIATRYVGLLHKYCQQTYGALVYQEQVMMVCRDLAGMSWGQSSKVIKIDYEVPDDHPLKVAFIDGAFKKSGLDMASAKILFNNLTSYTFNRGHAAAYAVLSYWGMWLKVHHPSVFFLELLKENQGDDKIYELEADAVANKLPVFLAHVNGQANYHTFEPFPGEVAIRQGYGGLKNVGPVASKAIDVECLKNGEFGGEEEFVKRMNREGSRKVITSRVLDALKGAGALEFNFDVYKSRTVEYNSYLVSRKLFKNGKYVRG